MVLLSFIVSVVATGVIVFFANRLSLGMDSQLKGAQKFHQKPTPRIGGIAVYCAVGVGCWFTTNQIDQYVWLAGMVAFLGGLAEDMWANVSPSRRLICTFLSSTVAFFLVDAQLRRVGVVGFNDLFAHSLIASLIFTAFAVGGVAHSLNIIDGLNGLMLGFCLVAFGVFGILAYQLGDDLLVLLALLGAGASLGLMAWNFPFGRIFCGDGGAYFLGFWLAEIAVLLVARHDEVSPWFGFLVMSYPVVETLFSMYRKKVLRKMSPGLPDAVHLHMLIYQRIVRSKLRASKLPIALQNAVASPLLWALGAVPAFSALWFWDNTPALLLLLIGFTGLYLTIYWRLVAFGVKQASNKR